MNTSEFMGIVGWYILDVAVCSYSIIKANRKGPVKSRDFPICLYSFSTCFNKNQPKTKEKKERGCMNDKIKV